MGSKRQIIKVGTTVAITCGVLAVGYPMIVPYFRRQLSQGPRDYMGPKAARNQHIVFTDIPIPYSHDEKFDTSVLVDWYEEQQAKGLIEEPKYQHPSKYVKQTLSEMRAEGLIDKDNNLIA